MQAPSTETVECEMTDVEGGTGPFEMEDQRLWTDASFKSYTPPLSAPHPYPLSPGALQWYDFSTI